MNKTGETVREPKPGALARSHDRRVRRTAEALTHALVALVLEKRYDAITVQDLLDYANVGRSTFYSHYRGKDDLLLRSFERMLEMMDRQLDDSELRIAPVRELFEHVGVSRPFYQALRRARVLDRMFQVGIDRLSLTIERRLAARGDGALRVPAPVAARSMAGALCALLRWWVEIETRFTPDDMDRMYHSIGGRL